MIKKAEDAKDRENREKYQKWLMRKMIEEENQYRI